MFDRKCFDSAVDPASIVFNDSGGASSWGNLIFRQRNTTLSFHYWILEPGSRYWDDSSGHWQHGDLNYNHRLDCTGKQDDSDLLFFEWVFQLSSHSRVHSIENKPNLLLQNATVVLAIVHPQTWRFQVTHLDGPYSVPLSYGCLLFLSHIRKYVFSILLCSECDDPNWFFCEVFLRGKTFINILSANL